MNPKIHNLSLQGFTGIFFGIFAIAFTGFIHTIINEYTSSSGMSSVLPISFLEFVIGILGVLFVLISYFVIVLVNRRRRKVKGWNINAKYIRLVFFIYFLILIVSAYLCVYNGVLKSIIPIALSLYGLSCIIADRYTNGPTKILGLFFAMQSLLAVFFSEVQFLLLAVSFGGFHVIYGIIGSKKLRKNQL